MHSILPVTTRIIFSLSCLLIAQEHFIVCYCLGIIQTCYSGSAFITFPSQLFLFLTPLFLLPPYVNLLLQTAAVLTVHKLFHVHSCFLALDVAFLFLFMSSSPPTCPSNSRPSSKPSSVYTFHRDYSCPSILKLPVISLLIWCWLHDHSSLSVVSQKFSLVIKRFIYDSCFLWNIPMFCSLLNAYEHHVSFSQSP